MRAGSQNDHSVGGSRDYISFITRCTRINLTEFNVLKTRCVISDPGVFYK